MKQAKVITKLGGFQVQLSTSMSYYVLYINLMFVGMMFWHTTAAPNLRPYAPWVDFWMFASFMLILVAALMILDYKFIYPSRQGFLNKQAYKHDNPAVADLQNILKNQKKIMKKLGIKGK